MTGRPDGQAGACTQWPSCMQPHSLGAVGAPHAPVQLVMPICRGAGGGGGEGKLVGGAWLVPLPAAAAAIRPTWRSPLALCPVTTSGPPESPRHVPLSLLGKFSDALEGRQGGVHVSQEEQGPGILPKRPGSSMAAD